MPDSVPIASDPVPPPETLPPLASVPFPPVAPHTVMVADVTPAGGVHVQPVAALAYATVSVVVAPLVEVENVQAGVTLAPAGTAEGIPIATPPPTVSANAPRTPIPRSARRGQPASIRLPG